MVIFLNLKHSDTEDKITCPNLFSRSCKQCVLALSIYQMWGLARYSVHMTATWDHIWKIPHKDCNYTDGLSLVSYILHLQKISNQNSFAIQQFIKADPTKSVKYCFKEIHLIDKPNIYVKSKNRHTNHFTVKQGTVWKRNTLVFFLKIN